MDKGKTVERKGTEKDRDAAVADWTRGRDLNLAELFDAEKVKKASLYHNTIAAGTAQDKILVLTGRPSGILGVRMDLATFLTTRGEDEPAGLTDGNTIEGELVTGQPKPSVERETGLQEVPGDTQRAGVES